MRKNVVITGAAHGIGKATAHRFAAGGWRVGLYDVDEVGLQLLAGEIRDLHGEDAVVAGHLDVTDVEGWRRALAEFVAGSQGRLELLINNAGVLRGGRFDEVDPAEHHRTIAINVNGVINGCHAAYEYLKATPGAGVVNLCSASAIYGQPEIASYSASKFAVRGLTEALELEWRREDIRVQAVWPLWVDTSLIDGSGGATSVGALGVNLTVDDVAEALWQAGQPPKTSFPPVAAWRRRVPRVHTAVGFPAKALAASADLVPSWLTREVNRRISRA